MKIGMHLTVTDLVRTLRLSAARHAESIDNSFVAGKLRKQRQARNAKDKIYDKR